MEETLELKPGVDFSSWTKLNKDKYEITVGDIKEEDIKPLFSELFHWEEGMRLPENAPEDFLAPQVYVYIKHLPYKIRLEILRFALASEDCLDMLLLVNIYNLIKKFNTFSDDFFSSKLIFANNAEEFLDLINDLHDELESFRKNLILWAFSAIKSCGVVESISEKPVRMPYAYQMVLFMTDFISLSNMLKSDQEIHGRLHLVGNADNIVLSLSRKQVLMYDMIENLQEGENGE